MSEKLVITTALVSFLSGFMLGIYSIRGYLIPPSLVAEREANWKDPVESEESDIDESDTILDHAPNWTNGEEADRKQGLKAVKKVQEEAEVGLGAEKVVKQKVEEVIVEPKPTEAGFVQEGKPGEECKLVLVVRTDLGMTKGRSSCHIQPSNYIRHTADANTVTICRQDSGSVRPRNASMLQDPVQSSSEEPQLGRSPHTKALGAKRSG